MTTRKTPAPRKRAPAKKAAPKSTLRNDPLQWLPDQGDAQKAEAPPPEPVEATPPPPPPEAPDIPDAPPVEAQKQDTAPQQGEDAQGRNEDMTSKSDDTPQNGQSEENWLADRASDFLDVATTPVVLADKDFVIRYVNKAAVTMFSSIEHLLQEVLPDFDLNELVGSPMDVFHTDPEQQTKMLSSLKKTFTGKIEFDSLLLAITVAPLKVAGKPHDGYILELQDRTAERDAQATNKRVADQFDKLLQEMNDMSRAHDEGDIDVFIDADSFDSKRVQNAAALVNAMVNDHINTKKATIAVFQAFGEGDFSADLKKQPGKRIFLNNAVNSVRDNFRGVTDEIKRLSNAIVDGNLEVEADLSQFKGEYREIVQSFQAAFDSLNLAFSSINDQVSQLTQTVDRMREGSTALATNSQIASSSVDEVSASAEETDAQVTANAESARNANDLVNAAAEVAESGKEKINGMVGAMQGINASSQDIAKIIKVIDEIAFQTNLLALNAAVEAARAGQHGRGFAVVAQEVRNLAGRSAKAARETSDLIEDAGKRVQSGVQIANETSEAFVRIADDINSVKALVEEITRSSSEQSRGVAQITTAIGEVAKTALATSEQADDMATTAEQMGSATSHIASELSRFRLKPVNHASGQDWGSLSNLPPEMLAQIRGMMEKNGQGGSMPFGGKNGAVSGDIDERGFENF